MYSKISKSLEFLFFSTIAAATNATTSDVNWFAVPDCLKGANFTSVDRDNYEGTPTKWVEFMIAKPDCSYQSAEQILELLLIGQVNETLDENNNTVVVEGIVCNFSSTKLDGYAAALMNLPSEVISLIPTDRGQYPNSPAMDEVPDVQTEELPTCPKTTKRVGLPGFLAIFDDALSFFINVAAIVWEFAHGFVMAALSQDPEALVEFLFQSFN